jgi:hypothetical protein
MGQSISSDCNNARQVGKCAAYSAYTYYTHSVSASMLVQCSAVSISALLLLALLSTATITTAEQYCHYIILHYSQYYTVTATVTATSCSY